MNNIFKNKWLSLLILLLLTPLLSAYYGGCAGAGYLVGPTLELIPYDRGKGVCLGMSGKVVDSETGEPIEGAIILVEWTKVHGTTGLHHEPSKVVELLSDEEGKFRVSGVENPFHDPPEVTVYKKGYICWNSTYIFPKYKKRKDFEWGTTYIFKLKRFMPEYSYIKHTAFIDRVIYAGPGKKKIFLEKYRWEKIEASKEREKRI
jgi:hypothetical protein